MARVLVISDTQAPFQHPDTISTLKRVRREYKCDVAVHIGDVADNKFLKYLSINDPDSAELQHRKALKFLKELYKEFPEVFVCSGNHDGRLHRVAEGAMIPSFMLKTPKEYLECPVGWHWADYWDIDGVRYEHGDVFGGQKPHWNAVDKRHQSVVMGHHANLGVEYFERNSKTLFGMCVAALTIDANDIRMGYGMAYAKRYSTAMPRGCGVVIDGRQAIPVPL